MNVKFKKILSFGVVLASVGLILTACSGKKSGQSANKDTKHGIALITDENGVDDHSFNQAAWSGFKAYGKEKVVINTSSLAVPQTSLLTLIKPLQPATKPFSVLAIN